MILLMDKILHHLGWLKPYINNGIIIMIGGAGFVHQQYVNDLTSIVATGHFRQKNFAKKTESTIPLYWEVPRFFREIYCCLVTRSS